MCQRQRALPSPGRAVGDCAACPARLLGGSWVTLGQLVKTAAREVSGRAARLGGLGRPFGAAPAGLGRPAAALPLLFTLPEPGAACRPRSPVAPQHDAQMDYYGTRLATCSSDRSVKIFDVRNGGQILIADLRG